jgi:methionyl-tRNA formyltransferase
LAGLGAALLVSTLARIDSLPRLEQDDAQATLAPKIRKEDGRVSWTDKADAVDRKVLALGDKPGVFTAFKGKRVNIISGRAHGSAGRPSPGGTADGPGTVLGMGKAGLEVACGAATSYLIEELQPEGKSVMSAHAFSLGTKIAPGDSLG